MAAFNISLGATADEQDNLPIDSYCPSWRSYSTWEQRQSNAQALADKLRHGAMKNRGFLQASHGAPPDEVFGLVMCYVDFNWSRCESYLSGVPYFVGVGCPYTWMAGAFYDACVLRYSNESFFPVADLSIGSTITDEGRFYAHDMDRMRKTRQKLISRLSLEAAASSLRFANGSETYMDPQSNSQAMFGLVQCSRDLAPSECTKCAEDAHISMIEHYPNSTAASIKGYSCYVRYTTDPMEITTPPPVLSLIGLGTWVWLFMHRPKKRLDEMGMDLSNDVAVEDELRKGTGPKQFRNFADGRKLGEGGFGSVYKGFFKDLNLDVAIKRVSKSSKQGMKEYISELRTISRLRHRNLVQLIGWCHGGGELLLVYELMPGGSLNTHLYNTSDVLTWPIRHGIVLGISSAIMYLHQGWEQCVLHRDIKPSNIMLDTCFSAKLGDFGLARLVDHSHGSYTTELAGTMGYMDPDCMVTGRATAERTSGETLFLKGRVLDAADPRLIEEFNFQEMERVIVVGLWCTSHDRSLRPSIRQAISVLRFEAPLPSLPTRMPPVGPSGSPFLPSLLVCDDRRYKTSSAYLS
ncbi:hypothetical protein VPH35_012556 [Triticum aestivum]